MAARLTRERLRAAREDRTEAEPIEPEPVESWSWTPERVTSALEEIISRGGQLIRRARWLCALSESALAWREGSRPEEQRRLLVLSSATFVRRAALSPGEPVSSLPGCSRPLIDRQRSFDLMSYDRLVVVTSELRRLVSEGTPIELWLDPKRRLDRETLARVLPWV